jgi:predicted secreted protein
VSLTALAVSAMKINSPLKTYEKNNGAGNNNAGGNQNHGSNTDGNDNDGVNKMRNSIKIIYLIFIILMLCVPVTASKTEKENTIHKGGIYTVTLNENPSTGYTWYVICSDGLEELSEKLTPSTSHLLGAAGIREIKFQAIKKGKQTIKAKYKRPWEKSCIKYLRFELNVI